MNSAKKRERASKKNGSKFSSDIRKRTGVNMVTTLQNLDSMSKVILDSPELMEDAERADQMLIAAIRAKLEIIELL